ncbi:MAG: hypothetical protein LBV50_02365, partial [Novosphingobium sp.]|nr:hypothetical protein [Novosphingobium sp.]
RLAGKQTFKPPPHPITDHKTVRVHPITPKREIESLLAAEGNPYCPQTLETNGAEIGFAACNNLASALNVPMSTSAATPMRTKAQTARSNIHAGISSHRSDIAPVLLQRKISEPARSTAS